MRWWHLPEVLDIETNVFTDTAWTVEQFFGELAAPDRWLRVGLDPQGRVRGYVDVACGGEDADLMTIAVDQPWQGHGWGRLLLEAALTHARTAGARRLTLEVRADNPAIRLYQAAGFRTLATRPDYYGPHLDALVMQCRIPDANALPGDDAPRMEQEA